MLLSLYPSLEIALIIICCSIVFWPLMYICFKPCVVGIFVGIYSMFASIFKGLTSCCHRPPKPAKPTVITQRRGIRPSLRSPPTTSSKTSSTVTGSADGYSEKV